MWNSNAKLYNFTLILLLFVHLKHHFFVQLSHLYLTDILFFKFLLIKNPDLSALTFGLTEFSFNKMFGTSKAQEKHDKTSIW